MSGRYAPTALTWAPGASRPLSNTGVVLVVQVQTMSAVETASAVPIRISMPSSDRRSTRLLARGLDGEVATTVTRSIGRTANIA